MNGFSMHAMNYLHFMHVDTMHVQNRSKRNRRFSISVLKNEKTPKSVTFSMNQVVILCKMMKTPLAYYKRK